MTGQLEWLIKKNLVYIIIVLGLIGALLYKTYSSTSSTLKLNKLKVKKRDILTAQKKLQNAYFQEGSIERLAFEKKRASQQTELNEVKKELRELTKAGKK